MPRRDIPYNGAFRMLSSVLFSKMAIRVNIAITRALVLSENIVTFAIVSNNYNGLITVDI